MVFTNPRFQPHTRGSETALKLMPRSLWTGLGQFRHSTLFPFLCGPPNGASQPVVRQDVCASCCPLAIGGDPPRGGAGAQGDVPPQVAAHNHMGTIARRMFCFRAHPGGLLVPNTCTFHCGYTQQRSQPTHVPMLHGYIPLPTWWYVVLALGSVGCGVCQCVYRGCK